MRHTGLTCNYDTKELTTFVVVIRGLGACATIPS